MSDPCMFALVDDAGIVRDESTGEVCPELTAESMENSDNWFEMEPEIDAADRLAAHPNAAQAEARILAELEGV